jgi:RNA polymerase sigma factor (sigma-70 family)
MDFFRIFFRREPRAFRRSSFDFPAGGESMFPSVNSVVPVFCDCSDEHLVVRAKTDSKGPAMAELVTRHSERVRRQIAGLCHANRLRPSEMDDAFQEGMLGFLKAIRIFDPGRWTVTGPARFASFQYPVVLGAVQNFLKRRRRRENHLDRSQNALQVLQETCESAAGRLVRRRRAAPDPLALLLHHESTSRLFQAMNRLCAEERVLLQGFLDGKTQRQLARELGVVEATVRRRLARLLDKLQSWVGEGLQSA